MRGAVPQKGLKMKLSINQGPFVSGVSVGFHISRAHCQELSNFLWQWCSGLPDAISQYIEIITVSPFKVPNGERIAIKVVLSGSYMHNHSNSQELKPWRSEFDVHIFGYSSRAESILKWKKDLEETLNTRLRSSFKKEIESYQGVVSQLSTLDKFLETPSA